MTVHAASRRRREDDRLLRGAGRFVADLREPGCVEAAFVRATVAHARLDGVGLDRTRQVPGVLVAFSAADLPDLPATPPMAPPDWVRGRAWPALAADRIRYQGQPVAIVIGRDRYSAEDGCDAAEVTVAPLPALLDPGVAAESGIELFDGLGNVAVEQEFGDAIDEAVWRDAAVVVSARYRQPLLAHTSLEARAILARPDGPDRLTIWCSHQAPHRLRDDLAGAFGLAPAAVRVIVPDVGGAFGGKAQTYPEYVAVVAAARRMGRPVRWVEDRAEALAGPPHGRGQNQRTRLAADAHGHLLGYQLEIDADIGAYPHTGAFIPMTSARIATGSYAIPQVHVRVRAVLTTTAPTTPYRGAGRPEAASAIERTIDLLARRLGLDPAEVRRRNHIPPGAFPYRTPTGFTYDSGAYTAAMDLALATAGYPQWRAEQQRRRESGEGRPLGIGICTYVERSGVGGEFAAVEACPDGTFLAWSGCCATGQGHETSFPQVVAAVLGVGAERVRLIEGDTDLVPSGSGTMASRSMQIGGAALHDAASQLVAEARRRMAERCAVASEAVTYAAGRLVAGDRTATLADLAAQTGPLRGEQTLAPPEAFPFGTYVAVVEVDPELGEVSVLRLVGVDDCGVVVNHSIVDGQVYGSTVQGIGQALYEQVQYTADGRLASDNLLDYSIPTLSEVPPMVFAETVTPDPNTSLGAKGAGEAGSIGAPPAIVNAVADALDLHDPSVLQMPLTPDVCWAASRAGGRA